MVRKPSRRSIPCYTCSTKYNELKADCDELNWKLQEQEDELEQLRNKCAVLETEVEELNVNSGFKFQSEKSDYCHPKNLKMDNFKDYVLGLLAVVPILSTILSFFMSKSHKVKLNATNTNPKWKKWSYFYQAWLLDNFLRSRAPKQVRRTTLLLSAYMLLCNLSEPCWRLLQRLKVLASKDTVEKWIKSYKKQVTSKSSSLFYVFDNCNFRLNVATVRSNYRSSFLNIINQFLVEIPEELEIPAASLWQTVDRGTFGAWLSPSFHDTLIWENHVWHKFINRPMDKQLKYLTLATWKFIQI